LEGCKKEESCEIRGRRKGMNTMGKGESIGSKEHREKDSQ